MYNSLKKLIVFKKYNTKEDAILRIYKAYPNWINESQRDELLGLANEKYNN